MAREHGASAGRGGTLDEATAALEERMIIRALQDTSGNMAKAARLLGITKRTMGLRMKRHRLEYREFRRKRTEREQ